MRKGRYGRKVWDVVKIEYKDPRKFEEEILEKEQKHELGKKDIQELQAIDDLMEELERIVRPEFFFKMTFCR